MSSEEATTVSSNTHLKLKKRSFWKGIGIGVSVTAVLLGGLVASYEAQETQVVEQEMLYQPYNSSSSILEFRSFEKLAQSPAFKTAEWKEYAALRNDMSAERANEMLNETRRVENDIWFLDLKDRLHQLSTLSPNAYQAYYPQAEIEKEVASRIGLNSEEDKKSLYMDIILSCEAQLGIDEHGHISRTDSSGEKGPYLFGDITINTSDKGELSEKHKKLLKNGLLPVIEDGKKIFC